MCCPTSARPRTTSAAPTTHHGAGGPLGVSDVRDQHPLAAAFIEAAQQCGYPRNDDFNGATQEGAGFYQNTMRNGVRSSTAAAYLKPARKRANLHVVSEALASRILFDGRSATGVEYLADGATRTARANAEVLVAGGAFNSPQLLQLSGLGPAEHLRSLGIPVIADLPGVGNDLNDHYFARIILRCSEPITLNDAVRSWRQGAKAVLRYALFPPRLFRHAGDLGRLLPARACRRPRRPTCNARSRSIRCTTSATGSIRFSGFTITCTLLRPESRGHVRIKSADPRQAPAIHPNYLATQKDRDTLVAGVKVLRRMAQAPALARYIAEEVDPGPGCTERRRAARLHPPPRLDRLSSGQHLPHGPGPEGGGRRAAQGARLRAAAGDRRLDHAGGGIRQHQCRDHHDRREGRRHGAGGRRRAARLSD